MNELERTLLEQARQDFEPRASDQARIRAKLDASIAVGASTGLPSVPPSAPSPFGAIAWKVGAALLLAGVLSPPLLEWTFGQSARTPLPAAPAVPASAPTVDVALTAPPSSLPIAPPPAASTDDGPGRAVRARSAPRAAPTFPTPPPSAPRAAAPVDARQPVAGPDDALSLEVAALTRARLALRDGDAHAALEAVDAHAARFPTGALARDREVLRVLALCASGRLADARAAADALRAEYPAAAELARLRSSCVTEP